ncbi:beta-amylase 8-like [Wolffia australiana]
MNGKGDLDQNPTPPSSQRRPRGFAATAAAAAAAAGSNSGASAAAKGRKERDKEKERTKLRERHRRAITSRMLAGFRQYGNFQLHARADMNDVLAALARQAGWTVEPDGTTYRSSTPGPPPSQPLTPSSAGSLKNSAVRSSLECNPPILMIEECLSPASLDSVMAAEKDQKSERYGNSVVPAISADSISPDQLMHDVQPCRHNDDFSATPYIPVFAMLPAGVVNGYCQLVDVEGVRGELRRLELLGLDGVVVECWWGIVEGWGPQKYCWAGYRDLFTAIADFKLKVHVTIAFHEGSHVPVSLPKWVLDVAKENPDIFFADRAGRHHTDCLSLGVDGERVLCGRTALEVYFDMMRSFRAEFEELFACGLISGVEVGLGASGELKFPSFPDCLGWRYPGIGEFQCYDRYMLQSLEMEAKRRGQESWGRGPDNTGHYNARPQETAFFCDGGDYDGLYGRFFLRWYSNALIIHADRVLSLARLLFPDTLLIVKIPAVYWWYRTASHAAELTAGYYNPANRDGYLPLFDALAKHSAAVKLVFAPTAEADALTWQVLNSAWDRGLTVAGQAAAGCLDRESLRRLLAASKPRGHPDGRHLAFFVTSAASSELHHLVKCMHGELP